MCCHRRVLQPRRRPRDSACSAVPLPAECVCAGWRGWVCVVWSAVLSLLHHHSALVFLLLHYHLSPLLWLYHQSALVLAQQILRLLSPHHSLALLLLHHH